MPTTVNDVYDIVCLACMEDGGFSSGAFTEAQFLRSFGTVLLDFLNKAKVVKTIYSQRVVSGTSEYSVPERMMAAEMCFIGGKLIEKETMAFLDSSYSNWTSDSEVPRNWHSDNLDVKTVKLFPNPSYSGTAGASKYGGFYPTERNLAIVGTEAPASTSWVLSDTITVLPDIFVHYIGYGIMAGIFSSDGEMKDPQRALYCRTRYEEGISLARALSEEEVGDIG